MYCCAQMVVSQCFDPTGGIGFREKCHRVLFPEALRTLGVSLALGGNLAVDRPSGDLFNGLKIALDDTGVIYHDGIVFIKTHEMGLQCRPVGT